MTVVLTTLTSTLLIQLGYFLWKISAEFQPKIGESRARDVAVALLSDWRWLLGLLSTSAGWVFFVQATALGDISLVQPLMSAGDLLLVVLAVIFLKERLQRIEWVGVAATVLGATALAFEAEDSTPVPFSAARLLVLMALVGLGGAAALWASRRQSRPEIYLALVVGLSFGAGSALTKALTTGATASGQLLITWSILLEPLLLAVVLANVFGLVLLQAAFQRGRAAVIVPLQLAMANAITVLAGVVVFGEHISLLRGTGIALIVAGTAILHIKPEPSQ